MYFIKDVFVFSSLSIDFHEGVVVSDIKQLTPLSQPPVRNMPGSMIILLILATSLVPNLTEGTVDLLVTTPGPGPDLHNESYIRLLGKRTGKGLRVYSRVFASQYLRLLKTRHNLRGPWIPLNTSLLGVG